MSLADDQPNTRPAHSAPPSRKAPVVVRTLLDALRGALIGAAEVVPGVSGGTVALVVGVYGALIDGAGHLARGTGLLVLDGIRGRGLARTVAHYRSVRWPVVLPIGVGMIAAILIGARILAPLLESHPVGTRAVFAGLIMASLIVPIRMVGGRWSPRDIALGLVAAAVSFALTGIPPAGEIDPPLIVVAIAGAVAVCALVLPGVSGSFLLLAVGMYAPTLAAVNDLDFAYLGAFIVGAMLGLGVFVSGLQWLLAYRRRLTLVIMTGLMLGSLRALWPWQSSQNELLLPGDDVGIVIVLFLAGASVVAALIVAENRLLRRNLLSEDSISDPVPDDEFAGRNSPSR